MKSPLPVTQMNLTRQERLELHMRRAGLTYKQLGRMVGITGMSASRNLRSTTIPPEQYAAWRTVIPADLLPQPVRQKSGPKPKNSMTAVSLDQDSRSLAANE